MASTRPLATELSPAELGAWRGFLRAHAALVRALDAELQAAHGLTVVAYEALLLLARADAGAMRRVDLAEGLGLTPSGVTRLLDGLEQRGLVEKGSCSSDARVSYAVITDAGRERLDTASCSHVASVRALFEERYTEEELETLAALLRRLPGAGAADADECMP
jgi:DNA-binding MarR family transcriptional regulator